MRAIARRISQVSDSSWFKWMLEAWTVGGWSVFGVLLVLLFIAATCGGACALACYIIPRPLVVVGPLAFPRVLLLVGPLAAWAASKIWREMR